ncbi:MAG: four helix bundle protein [Chitinophagaceae bacterium]
MRFSSVAIDLAESLPKSYAGNYVACQLIRSSTSPVLNYGEAQAAESRNDFIHKMKICLRDLRETYVCLQLIKLKKWTPNEAIDPVFWENNELFSVFVSSLKTAQFRGKTLPTSKF